MEEDVLARMGISANFNEANVIRLMECLFGDQTDIHLGNDDSAEEPQSEVDSEDDLKGRYRRTAKPKISISTSQP